MEPYAPPPYSTFNTRPLPSAPPFEIEETSWIRSAVTIVGLSIIIIGGLALIYKAVEWCLSYLDGDSPASQHDKNTRQPTPIIVGSPSPPGDYHYHHYPSRPDVHRPRPPVQGFPVTPHPRPPAQGFPVTPHLRLPAQGFPITPPRSANGPDQTRVGDRQSLGNPISPSPRMSPQDDQTQTQTRAGDRLALGTPVDSRSRLRGISDPLPRSGNNPSSSHSSGFPIGRTVGWVMNTASSTLASTRQHPNGPIVDDDRERVGSRQSLGNPVSSSSRTSPQDDQSRRRAGDRQSLGAPARTSDRSL